MDARSPYMSGVEIRTNGFGERLGEPSWVRDAIFLHVYPMGACDAPATNDFHSAPVHRLEALIPWADAWADLGIEAIYLGPIFESGSHGYDTADYVRIDRRLGDDATFDRVLEALRRRNIRVVVDAVFNHVGRHFWAFRDVQARGPGSPYASWFAGLRFDRGGNRFGDPFRYDGWRGIDTLVKLNLREAQVREHLFAAIRHWSTRFGIDGLRLDAADAIELPFFDALAGFCDALGHETGKPLWRMGEVIHGDYRDWARPGRLHSTTDYALFKALWSSHNDHNYFELAHTLKRQVARDGMYEGLTLYTFVDNHDVDRLASTLKDPAHLALVYALLLTLPGAPSIYAGSEWGAEGKKRGGDDSPLRPKLPVPPMPADAPHPWLREVIRSLARLRREHPALRHGDYRELLVKNEQLAFAREVAVGSSRERVIVVTNTARTPGRLELRLPSGWQGAWHDWMNPGVVTPERGALHFETGQPWFRVLGQRA